MAVQVPTFKISGRNMVADASGLGEGIGKLISSRRERTREDELLAQQAEKDRAAKVSKEENALLAALHDETDLDRRAELAQQIAKNASPIFAGQLKQLGAKSVDAQNSIIRASLQADGDEGFFAKPVAAKKRTIKTIDTGKTIQVLDGETGEVIREVQKGQTEAEQLENELNLQKKSDDIKSKREEVELKRIGRVEATRGLRDQAVDGIALIGKIRVHPGFQSAVGAKGASSAFGFFDEPVGGSDAAGAVSLIENLEAKNFLVGVKEFKASGGKGGLSDNEGKKLAAAIVNLKRSQSEKDFLLNLAEIERLLEKQKRQAAAKLPKNKNQVINFEDL